MKHCILIVLSLALLLSCEDKQEDSNKDLLTDTWILLEEYFAVDQFSVTHTYSGDLSTATIYDIRSDQVTVYENNFCSSDYSSAEGPVTITNSTISMNVDTLDYTFDYTLNGDELVLSAEYTEYGSTWSMTLTLEKYGGDIPPAEWSAAGDDYEPDDTLSTATAITVDSNPQSHILCGGESDWFSFDATSGTNYVMETFNDNGLDTYLELYDADGNYITYDDDEGTDWNARLSWTCNSDGTYYFKVHGFYYDPDEEGPYTVSVVSGAGRISTNSTGEYDKQQIKHIRNQVISVLAK